MLPHYMAYCCTHTPPLSHRWVHNALRVTEEMREDFLATWDGIVEP
jgi:hypothetical protein